MKRRIPLLITFFIGLIIILSNFIPHKPFGQIQSSLETWFIIISSFAIVLGNLNLLKMNFLKIKYKQTNWKYYIFTVASFFLMIILGLVWGTKSQAGMAGHGEAITAVLGAKPFDYLFSNVYEHLQATMFSLLAFYIASAAYRAFVGRSIESNLLLGAAILVMLGNTSIGTFLTAKLPPFLQLSLITEFIMKYLNTAGQRAIMICAGLGIIGSSLRIIIGIERSYLGGE